MKNITQNIYTFSRFVEEMEINYGNLDCWLEMEIVNAVALNEWEEDNCPEIWDKWKLKYKKDAEEVLLNFLSEIKR